MFWAIRYDSRATQSKANRGSQRKGVKKQRRETPEYWNGGLVCSLQLLFLLLEDHPTLFCSPLQIIHNLDQAFRILCCLSDCYRPGFRHLLGLVACSPGHRPRAERIGFASSTPLPSTTIFNPTQYALCLKVLKRSKNVSDGSITLHPLPITFGF